MKAPYTQTGVFSRQQRWSAFLSTLALLVLVLSPLCHCAMAAMQVSAGHLHPVSAGVESVSEFALGDHHREGVDHHNRHHSQTKQAGLSSSVPQSDVCCCESNVPPVVLSASQLSAVSDTTFVMPDIAIAILPGAQNLFALSSSHGRDAPLSSLPVRLLSHSSSLFGRAPPFSV